MIEIEFNKKNYNVLKCGTNRMYSTTKKIWKLH